LETEIKNSIVQNMGVLYLFELKKILQRKIVWITLFGMIVLLVLMGTWVVFTGTREVNGVEMPAMDAMKQEREYARALEGQAIDGEMLAKMQKAYRSCRELRQQETTKNGSSELIISQTEGEFTDEYLAYKAVYDYVVDVVGMGKVLTVTEEELYQKVAADRQTSMEEQYLTEGEKLYWQQELEEVEQPIRVSYITGTRKVWISFYTASVFLLMLDAICLANVFAEEHQRKTDQLILCSRHGRSRLYFCKMAAGITFGIGSAFLLVLAFAMPLLSVFSTDGFHTAIQLYMPTAPFAMTIGEMCWILLGIFLLTALMFSILTMFGSEFFRNGVASMAVMVCSMLLGMMVSVPDSYRVLAQLFNLLPYNILAVWSSYDFRLVPLLGGYLNNYQAAVILYAVVSGAAFWLGLRVYRRFQVSGR